MIEKNLLNPESIYNLTDVDLQEIEIRVNRFSQYQASHNNGKATYYLSKEMEKELTRISFLTGYSKKKLIKEFEAIGGFNPGKESKENEFKQALRDIGVNIPNEAQVKSNFANISFMLKLQTQMRKYSKL